MSSCTRNDTLVASINVEDPDKAKVLACTLARAHLYTYSKATTQAQRYLVAILEMGSPKYHPPRRSVLQKVSCLIAHGFLFAGGAALALSLVLALLSVINPDTNFDNITRNKSSQDLDSGYDPAQLSLHSMMIDTSASRLGNLCHRVLLVKGSQPSACSNPVGDHLLLRFFKNKVDYCRLHGCDIFYSNLALHPKVTGSWAKCPTLRAAMLAHPEAEWILWVDSDAIFTDMDFKLPPERYNDHNLVVHGWSHEVYVKHSRTGINSGVFLIRNCQWSMDLIEEWIIMGPRSPYYERWAQIQSSVIKDKQITNSDDQTGPIYLLIAHKETWAETHLENEYSPHGYWLAIVNGLDNITKIYVKVDREVAVLTRRHAEKVSQFYGAMREHYLKDKDNWRDYLRRPFLTHFSGCQPCSGQHSPAFTWEACWKGMQRALNFADNQVLSRFGFVHPDLLNSTFVSPLQFNFPA
ncbi:hypothetical protein FF1_004205 [Malus domestica]